MVTAEVTYLRGSEENVSRTARLLELLVRVQTKPRFTAQELAEEFGVSRRTMHAVKIGQKLRAERTRRFLTQDALAAKAGISQKQLSKIERDDVEPRFSTILRLADALGIEPERFLEGSG